VNFHFYLQTYNRIDNHTSMKMHLMVRRVERLFGDLEKEMNSFKSETGLHCIQNCGFCCTRPNVMASSTEFLPLAWALYKENTASQYLDHLELSPISLCPIFMSLKTSEHAGFCGNYKNRGLVCRLFGYSAMVNKHGLPELSTCKLIKEQQTDQYNETVEKMKNGMKIPVYSNYYRRLSNIDPDQAIVMLPIKEAIRKAIERVLWYQHYRASS